MSQPFYRFFWSLRDKPLKSFFQVNAKVLLLQPARRVGFFSCRFATNRVAEFTTIKSFMHS
jgi:hypothetical protein